MEFPIQLRAVRVGPWLAVLLLGCVVQVDCGLAARAQTSTAQIPTTQGQTQQGSAGPDQTAQSQVGAGQVAPAQSAETKNEGVAAGAHDVAQTPSKRHLRQAEDAYLAGAKKLARNDLDGAEREFTRAQKLNPANRDYAVAIALARQHRLTELVQQAGKEKQAGNQAKAERLLVQARAIDPENPIVAEHSGLLSDTSASKVPDAAIGQTASEAVSSKSGDRAASASADALAERVRQVSAGEERPFWSIKLPELAGAIQLAPSDGVKSFHMRGISPDLLRNVASEYGIRAVVDDSVQRQMVDFDLENVTYAQAMRVLMEMTNVFAVPLDENSVLIAKNLPQNRLRLLPLLEETIYLPGLPQDQINEIANVVRTVFDITQATTQIGAESIVVRAPQETLAPMNKMLEGLLDSRGEVLIEVKIYEVDTTRMSNAGANLPTAAGIYNVNQAATSLVNANQSLVQQGIAQGIIHPTDSNLKIAGELIASGLVQSSLLASTIGAIGGGAFMTGITETGSVAFNLGLNTSDVRTLDDVQMRVGDRQDATFREGTRYPIVASTYSSGISSSSLSSAVGNQKINGVPISSLISQYAGGSNVTIPQVTYEDLGVTLKATPTIQKAGRVSLKLDLKIEALSGTSSNGNPLLASRQLSSEIVVAEGESVLLVSNVSQTEAAAMSGIPGLSELPGFQAPVADDVQKTTDRLVLVVTPHVVRRRSNLLASPRILLRGEGESSN